MRYLSTILSYFITFIIVDRAVGAPGHGKYVVDVMNARHKQMIKSTIEELWNPELIRDYPIFSNFMQVHENEEDQDEILSK